MLKFFKVKLILISSQCFLSFSTKIVLKVFSIISIHCVIAARCGVQLPIKKEQKESTLPQYSQTL